MRSSDLPSSYVFVVQPVDRGKRLDTLLQQRFPHLSRRQIRELVDSGGVYINGAPGHKGARLVGKETIEVRSQLVATTRLQPDSTLQVEILYEDEHLVAVNKPSGMATHALHPAEQGTVANFLLARYPEMAGLSRCDLEAGLVHRLDNATSGVVLAARNASARAFLRAEFTQRNVKKGYWALVHGKLTSPTAIRAPIGHHLNNPKKMRLAPSDRYGRPAVTLVQPFESFKEHTLVWVEIETGVRHQIRVHLGATGHPIVGDALYGGTAHPRGRHFLHAAKIHFRHPVSCRWITVCAPLPPELEAWLQELRGQRSELV